MDLRLRWPRLRQESRDWLFANNGDALSRSVAEDVERAGGPVPPDAWWVGDHGPDGLHLSDAAVDWIEEVANAETPPLSGVR